MADQKQEKEDKTVVVAKNAAELQKIRLEKLMKNPAKPVHIPERSKDYKPRDPLEFVRNIWGSSAGAGSGDFHVYRGVRRREYARQKFDKEKNEKEEANDKYREKVVENMIAAEERTAKKRAKRLKKKQKQKNKKPKKEEKEPSDDDESDDDDEEEDGSTMEQRGHARVKEPLEGDSGENSGSDQNMASRDNRESSNKNDDSEVDVKTEEKSDSADSGNDSR